MIVLHKILRAEKRKNGDFAEFVLKDGAEMRKCYMGNLPVDTVSAKAKILSMKEHLWDIHSNDDFSETDSDIESEETKDSEIDDWDGTEENLKKLLKKLSKASKKR